MKRALILAVVFVAASVLAAVLFRDEPAEDAPPVPSAVLGPEGAPSAAEPTIRVVPLGEEQAAPTRAEAEAALAAYEAELAFGEEVRAFVEAAPGMSRAERRERAAALSVRTTERQERGLIVPVQSRALRLAIDAAAYADDPDELRRRADALAAEAAAAKPFAPDPSLADYKAREAAIVSEVMAMRAYPGGLSRGEYLRQRLDEVRAEVWARDADQPTNE